MGQKVILLFTSAILLTSCNENKNKPVLVGTIDSAEIARDTTMQLGFESSYEFHKTLVIHEHLVYDVVAYGGPASNGDYAILKRGADNKADTMLVGKRDGKIADAFLADSNSNGEMEIYVVVQNPTNALSQKTLRYETDGR